MSKNTFNINTRLLVATALSLSLIVILLSAVWPQSVSAAEEKLTVTTTQTLHKTINIDGVEIFYREAGPADAPTILLLHGFPTSSHMFRNLIPALSDKYHVVAPDYPGFGNSAQPAPRYSTAVRSTCRSCSCPNKSFTIPLSRLLPLSVTPRSRTGPSP